MLKKREKKYRRIKSYDWYNEEPQDCVHSIVWLRSGMGASPLIPCSPPCLSELQVLEKRTKLESSPPGWTLGSICLPRRRKKRTWKMSTLWPELTGVCLSISISSRLMLRALSRDSGRSVQGGATEGLGLTTKSRPRQQEGRTGSWRW